MVNNTLGRVAGIAAFVLMVSRLRRLLETSGEAPAWPLILVASAFLGGVIWWLVKQTVTSKRVALILFAAAGGILFLRIAVPQSLIAGFLPGPETPGALITEVSESFDIFRYGVSPVFPSSGIVAALAIVMWAIGGIFVWGAAGGPIVAMSLPSIAMYLQFAVMDRQPGGRGWMIAAVTVFALAIAAVANDQRSTAGRMRDKDGRPLPRRGGSMALATAALIALTSVALVGSASSLVPEDGNIQWRTGGGYGEGFGGIAFNRLVGLQKRVISRSNAELFRATVDAQAPPLDQIYWRMESLDRYDGQSWLPSDLGLARYSPTSAGGDPDYAYQGTTATFAQRIQIAALRGPLAPTAGVATALQSDTEDINQFQVAPDGSLIIQSQLDEGMTYQVRALFPLEKEDISALATGPNGQLTPLFAEASRVGAYNLTPSPLTRAVERPVDLDRFTELPEMPAAINAIARQKTAGAQSDFERATLLQHWFRDSGDFEYSTDVTPGHTNLKLSEWLTDEESPDYRIGYCEQFAASMAVLGRSLGIPSRVVWGFTPGEVVTQDDGSLAIVVRDRNAHAWVEMWMDGFGWVKFDPTPRSDGALPESYTAGFNPEDFVPDTVGGPQTIDQPGFLDETNTLGIDLSDNPVGDGSTGGFSISWWMWLIPLVLVASLAIPLVKQARRRRRIQGILSGDVTAAWDEIVDRLTDLGTEVPEFQTPVEFARSTDRSLVPLATAYGSAVYGGRANAGRIDDFLAVEGWMKLKYESGQRVRASFNPASLLRRRKG